MKKSAALLVIGIGLVLVLNGCGQAGETGSPEESIQTSDIQSQDTRSLPDHTDNDSMEEEAAGSRATQGETDEPVIKEAVYNGIKTAPNGARVSVHDPSIKVFDGRYYIYGSHMTGAYSDDLQTWNIIGNNYDSQNPLFTDLFAEGLGIFDYAGDYGDGTYSVWAEDVIYIEKMQKYVMYFCTSSTYIKSALCYATADAPEGPYAWQGTLLYSGFTGEDIDTTDVYGFVSPEYASDNYLKLSGAYNNEDWPNCIDPAPFYDEEGRLWMTYGSWSGGIFLLELDPATGLVIHPEADKDRNVDPYFGKRLLGGGHKSIEGPYIQYDPDTGFYYLYVSYGALDRTGGYQMRVFRSKTVDGDYVDMNGQYPSKGYNHSFYGLKLSENYYLPSAKYAYMATGGQSAFIDQDGKKYICYHSRFDNGSEYHEPCVKQVFMNQEGWPVLAPFTAKGETISRKGYVRTLLTGEYYFINQGTGIDEQIARPVMISLNEDGSVSGSLNGTWEAVEGTAYMSLSYQDKTYSGVFCQMKDQAGTDVMTFSAAGANESIWGVRY